MPGVSGSAGQLPGVRRGLQDEGSGESATPRLPEASQSMTYLIYARVSPKGSTRDGARTRQAANRAAPSRHLAGVAATPLSLAPTSASPLRAHAVRY